MKNRKPDGHDDYGQIDNEWMRFVLYLLREARWVLEVVMAHKDVALLVATTLVLQWA